MYKTAVGRNGKDSDSRRVMQPWMVYEVLCVAMVSEYNTGREFRKASVVQRETQVCVVIKNVIIF